MAAPCEGSRVRTASQVATTGHLTGSSGSSRSRRGMECTRVCLQAGFVVGERLVGFQGALGLKPARKDSVAAGSNIVRILELKAGANRSGSQRSGVFLQDITKTTPWFRISMVMKLYSQLAKWWPLLSPQEDYDSEGLLYSSPFLNALDRWESF